VLLQEDRDLYYNSNFKFPHMTQTVNASQYAVKNVPNVVHFDGTMRPQEVSINSNFKLYQLLKEFKNQTGIGLLMNTSFNRHGLPIVESPNDVLLHLKNGWVDSVVLGDFVVDKYKT
jgi:carbamoyltransferase